MISRVEWSGWSKLGREKLEGGLVCGCVGWLGGWVRERVGQCVCVCGWVLRKVD